METTEKLDALKKEVEGLNKKLAELTEEELKQVTGGDSHYFYCTDRYTECGCYQNYQYMITSRIWQVKSDDEKRSSLSELVDGCNRNRSKSQGANPRPGVDEIICPLFKVFLQEGLL